jgi:hypothetical protein
MLKLIIGVVVVAVMTALLMPAYALQGWVVVNLWSWFVPEALTTWVPSVWEAVGLMILIGVIRYKPPKIDQDEDPIKNLKAAGKTYLFEFFGPLISLGFGAIVKFWML